MENLRLGPGGNVLLPRDDFEFSTVVMTQRGKYYSSEFQNVSFGYRNSSEEETSDFYIRVHIS